MSIEKIELDPYCKKALRICLENNNGYVSVAFLQRNLEIGFNRAARIIDILQELKCVEEIEITNVSQKAKVIVELDVLDTLFPDMEF